MTKDNLDVAAISAPAHDANERDNRKNMGSQSMSSVETSPISQLSDAAAEHGIVLTAEQARMGAEWRDAMLNSVNAVRQIDVDGSEPASAFAPVTLTPQDRGG